MRVLWGVGGEGVECRERPRFHVLSGGHVRDVMMMMMMKVQCYAVLEML